MTSEIRTNSIKSRTGLSTVSYADTGIIVSGIVTATSYYGDGSNLTGISASSDKIIEGNTKAEVVDTNGNGHFKIETEGVRRFRVISTGETVIDDVDLIIGSGQNTQAQLNFFSNQDNASGRYSRIRKNYNSPFNFEYFASTSNSHQSHVFYSDLTTERVRISPDGKLGIGNASPSCKLAITDVTEHTAYGSVVPSVTASMLQLYNNPPNETANDHATMQFGVNGGTHNRVASISAVVESAANRKLAFAFCTDEAGSRTEKMRIHGDGHVTKPLNPAFRARASSGGWKSFGNTSFNIMPFNATDCNNGNHYNTSTYKFTVPVSGNYYFYCQMQHDGTTTNGGTSGQMQIVVQGVAVIAYGKSGRQGEVVNCGTVWPCSAGNVIYCEGRTNLTNPDDWHGDSYYSFFTGYLVG